MINEMKWDEIVGGRETKGRVIWFMSDRKKKSERNLKSLTDDLCTDEIEMSSITLCCCMYNKFLVLPSTNGNENNFVNIASFDFIF